MTEIKTLDLWNITSLSYSLFPCNRQLDVIISERAKKIEILANKINQLTEELQSQKEELEYFITLKKNTLQKKNDLEPVNKHKLLTVNRSDVENLGVNNE